MTGNNSNRKLKRIIIQDRDRRFFQAFAHRPVFARTHVEVIGGFGSVTRSNTRLHAYEAAGLVHRFFLGSGGGSRRAIYAITSLGAKLAGIPYRRVRRRKDEMLAVDFFAEHHLAINEIYCILKHRPIPTGTFVRWVTFYAPLAPGVALIPDGYAEVSASKIVPMFLEVDLATETLAVWQGKARAYVSYAASGKVADDFGQRQFRVLAVTTSDGRLASLRRATAAVSAKVFWFTTFARINQEGFWSAIWERPADGPLQTLL